MADRFDIQLDRLWDDLATGQPFDATYDGASSWTPSIPSMRRIRRDRLASEPGNASSISIRSQERMSCLSLPRRCRFHT